MKAERGLDALIAEKVMGWAQRDRFSQEPYETHFVIYPDGQILAMIPLNNACHGYEHRDFKPSISIAAAWEVVDRWMCKDKGKYWDSCRGFECWCAAGDGWVVSFWETGNDINDEWPVKKEDTQIRKHPLPEAICLAALKAVGVRVTGAGGEHANCPH